MKSGVTAWLLALLAVLYLTCPRGAEVTENTQHDYIAGAECADEGSDNGSNINNIIMVVLIVILIGAISDTCAEVKYEN